VKGVQRYFTLRAFVLYT